MGDQAGPEASVSVRRDLRLLESAGAHPTGAPAEQLAREAELPRPVAEEHLRALVEDGYLRELGDGAYTLADQGTPPLTAPGDATWAERLRPLLTSLRDRLSAAAYLTLYDEGRSGSSRSSTAPGRPASTSGSASRTPGTPRPWARACWAGWTRRPAPTTSPATPWPTSRPTPSPAAKS